jgi:DNA-binding CsgD family transcriptional regulator
MPDTSETLPGLLGSLYEAAADPARWDPFLEQLALSARATSAALVMHDFDHALCTVSSSWELNPESNRLYQEHYHALDVWAQAAPKRASGYVCNSESLCPLPELRKKEIYNDLFVPFGIEHGMFALLESNEGRFASVSLYRDKSRAHFTSPDLHILQLLNPHLQRAFKLRLHFSGLGSRSAGLEAALNMLPTGLVFLSARGEIVLMNRSATALAAERDGLLATRDGLRAERQAESLLLEKTIRQAASTSNGNSLSAGGTVLVSRREGPPLQILVSPIRNSSMGESESVAAVAFISDPLRRQRPAQETLRGLYRLTPAECRVALLLGDGHAPRKIANMIGVTDNTVRSQIKSIFSKTGVKRQGELIRLLMNNSEIAIQAKTAALTDM